MNPSLSWCEFTGTLFEFTGTAESHILIPEITFLNSFLCRTNQKETLEERVIKNRKNLPLQQLCRRVNKKNELIVGSYGLIVTFIRSPIFQIRRKKIVYLIVMSSVYYQH